MKKRCLWLLNNIKLCFLRHKISIGNKVHVNGWILLAGTKNVFIGNDVYINSNEKSNPIGGNIRCYFKTLRDGIIKIGDGCRISNTAIVSMKSVEIGKNVYIGGDCRIYDTDFHSLDYENRIAGGGNEPDVQCAAVVIKDGAFIGTSTIVLKGVEIGEKSIVGAGSVVTKSIPDGEVWAGNPARFIRKMK